MLKKRNLLFLSLLIMSVLLLSSCFSNPPATEGILKGQVMVPEGTIQAKDLTGQALPDATVNIIDLETGAIIATAVTDANGYYQVSVPAGGPYLLEAVKNEVKVQQITPTVEVNTEYDLGTADCMTTAAALIAQAMMDAGDNPADIDCAAIIADPNFDDVSNIVCDTIKDGGDPTASADVEQAVEDFLNPAPAPAPTYTVTFNKNGGDTEANPKTKIATYGGNVGTLPTAPTKIGYTFASWNTKDDGTGTGFTAGTEVTANITVYAKWKSTDATLSALTLSEGALAPGFASMTTAYTAQVANSITSMTVTPTATHSNATIKVNNVIEESGSPSASISLAVGANTITTEVTAEDGSTTKTYTLTVTRAASTDATLSDLTVAGTTIAGFNFATLVYNKELPYGTTIVPTVGAITNDPTASKAITQAASVTGIATVVVTAEDGATQKTYTVTFSVAVLEIGDSYGGGKVAYIDVTGQHGLIAAKTDQSEGIQWYNGTNLTTNAIGTAIGTGFANTYKIIAKQGTTITDYAAGLARAYNGGDFNDWFLPSEDELDKLYDNRVAIGGFAVGRIDIYWSSSEVDAGIACAQGFYDGVQYWGEKNFAVIRVRAVRAF